MATGKEIMEEIYNGWYGLWRMGETPRAILIDEESFRKLKDYLDGSATEWDFLAPSRQKLLGMEIICRPWIKKGVFIIIDSMIRNEQDNG